MGFALRLLVALFMVTASMAKGAAEPAPTGLQIGVGLTPAHFPRQTSVEVEGMFRQAASVGSDSPSTSTASATTHCPTGKPAASVIAAAAQNSPTCIIVLERRIAEFLIDSILLCLNCVFLRSSYRCSRQAPAIQTSLLVDGLIAGRTVRQFTTATTPWT